MAEVVDSEYLMYVSDSLHQIFPCEAWAGERLWRRTALAYIDEPCKYPCRSIMRRLAFVVMGMGIFL